MERAGERFAGAAALADHGGPTVSADAREHAQPRAVIHEEEELAEQVEGQVVAFLPHLAHVTNTQPARPEDGLDLALK